MKRILIVLLLISLFSFTLDLLHMIYHLADEPALFNLEGVGVKLSVKVILFSLVFLLMVFRTKWLRVLTLLYFFLILGSGFSLTLAATSCQHARELLDKSGTARDATENMFGQIKTHPPYGSFPSDMDKISWWGSFKPFEFWESPEFQAAWINPSGQEIARQKFRGQKCRLAKTTVRGENQPRGEFQSGMWNIIVTCDDYLIDKQAFAVLPAGNVIPKSDTPGQAPQEPAMIWAKDKLKDE